jgi:hypothetical protein
LVVDLSGSAARQEEATPDELFARAEELACAGRHADARARYETIAREHPSTRAGTRAVEVR